ncbi:hypothetical protein H109_06719 [Trichophyton interdigitale MR816]|uniref:Uncharacterized protein n=1 Tax=Trichophyton interdigitale (strain MR816) TaxID=1215338 RepID=A0A059J0G8_TRIIM|nr:hypothetical protein H109_06719 [Trichophyton interdigitale MR816]
MDEDSMRNPLRDLPYIRCFLCVLSSQCHIRGDVHSYAAKSTLEPFIACPIARRRLLIHDIKSDGMTQQSWAKILVIVLVFCAFAGDALGWSGPEEILASKRERHAITREKYSGKSILDIQQEMSSPMDVAAKQSSDMFPQADNGQTARSTSKPAPRRKEYNIV